MFLDVFQYLLWVRGILRQILLNYIARNMCLLPEHWDKKFSVMKIIIGEFVSFLKIRRFIEL